MKNPRKQIKRLLEEAIQKARAKGKLMSEDDYKKEAAVQEANKRGDKRGP